MDKIIDGSVCSLALVAMVLIGLGRSFSDHEQRKWAGFLALIGFVVFACYRLHMQPPRTADDLFGTPQGSPRTDRLIAASIQWAERIMQKIDKAFTQ